MPALCASKLQNGIFYERTETGGRNKYSLHTGVGERTAGAQSAHISNVVEAAGAAGQAHSAKLWPAAEGWPGLAFQLLGAA